MYAQATKLKPLSSVELSADEATIVKWIRSAPWQKVEGAREPVPYKAKVPEFYGGVRLYHVQAGKGAQFGALELLIKKLAFQGVLTKKEAYPIEGQGTAPRYLALVKADMDNLGVGKKGYDEEE